MQFQSRLDEARETLQKLSVVTPLFGYRHFIEELEQQQ